MAATLEELERRVKVLESEVAGEATLTRRAFEHVQEIRDDIAVLRKHSATTGDALEQLLQRTSRIGNLESQVLSLREAMPGIVGDVLREDRAAQRNETRDLVRYEVRDTAHDLLNELRAVMEKQFAALRTELRDALKGEGKA
jgi:hypothetical protein